MHCSSSYMLYNSFNNGSHWWIISVNYASLFKWSSGVFVMISGAFILKEEKTLDIWGFLKHRFIRIMIPFILWALFYKILENPSAVIETKGLIFRTYIADLYNGKVEYHLWFIYMIFILYLLSPVLSFLVNHAPKKVLYYFIGLWLVLNFIPDYLHQYKDWNFGSRYYLEFSKYSGLYMLGFILKNVKINKPWRLLIPFVALVLINAIGTYYLSNSRGYNDYFFLQRLNITNILNSILIYLFFISITIKSNSHFKIKRNKIIVSLSLLSYGIFLNHVFILNLLRKGQLGFKICSHSFLNYEVNPYIGSFLLFVFVLIGSISLAYILSKIPIAKKYLN